jgi:hypothetical protein
MLILGAGGAAVERADLMLPDGLLPQVLPPLEAAAGAMAAEGGPGWEFGLRGVSPRLATLTLFAPEAAPLLAAALPREALVLEEDAARRRLRLMLGVLPADRALRLRILLGGGVKAPPALFLDGARHAARRAEADARGGMLLEAVIRPAAAGGPTVLGLAGMGQGEAAATPQVERVEIAPA